MKLWSKIKDWLTEDHMTPQTVGPRAVARSESGVVIVANDFSIEPVRRLKKWAAAGLASAPWLAVAVILFAAVSHGAIASAALGYGLLKVSIAVLLTFIADETMFRGLKESTIKWLPMLRRTGVFMGICWLMAVT